MLDVEAEVAELRLALDHSHELLSRLGEDLVSLTAENQRLATIGEKVEDETLVVDTERSVAPSGSVGAPRKTASLTSILEADRIGAETWEMYCFVHGLPTLALGCRALPHRVVVRLDVKSLQMKYGLSCALGAKAESGI